MVLVIKHISNSSITQYTYTKRDTNYHQTKPQTKITI
ncbi:hypothetical protein OROGR_020119 [Orobanche gracilis]